MTNYLIIGAIAYFFGAIPFSFLIGLIFYRTDIRKHGSGNIGSTNLYRVLGPIPGVIGYILDTLKGALSVALLLFFFPFCASVSPSKAFLASRRASSGDKTGMCDNSFK